MIARLRASNGSIAIPQPGMGATINMSVIPPEESYAFMSRNEFGELYGSTVGQPI